MPPQEIKTTILVSQTDYTISLIDDPNRVPKQLLCLKVYDRKILVKTYKVKAELHLLQLMALSQNYNYE